MLPYIAAPWILWVGKSLINGPRLPFRDVSHNRVILPLTTTGILQVLWAVSEQENGAFFWSGGGDLGMSEHGNVKPLGLSEIVHGISPIILATKKGRWMGLNDLNGLEISASTDKLD